MSSPLAASSPNSYLSEPTSGTVAGTGYRTAHADRGRAQRRLSGRCALSAHHVGWAVLGCVAGPGRRRAAGREREVDHLQHGERIQAGLLGCEPVRTDSRDHRPRAEQRAVRALSGAADRYRGTHSRSAPACGGLYESLAGWLSRAPLRLRDPARVEARSPYQRAALSESRLAVGMGRRARAAFRAIRSPIRGTRKWRSSRCSTAWRYSTRRTRCTGIASP